MDRYGCRRMKDILPVVFFFFVLLLLMAARSVRYEEEQARLATIESRIERLEITPCEEVK